MRAKRNQSRRRRALSTCARAVLLGGAVLTSSAGAIGAAVPSESCRGWRAEHEDWKSRAVRAYLRGTNSRELDTALFELLQREAYLTSCDVSVAGARSALLGYRLVDRQPDRYGPALMESLLEQAGFDTSLRSRFDGVLPRPSRPVRTGTRAAPTPQPAQ
ncbi:MAG: hypothetical protein HRU01_28605 [Myxococcales bacterium]|nr:hypothetical protein [Myxococcales bacterium]